MSAPPQFEDSPEKPSTSAGGIGVDSWGAYGARDEPSWGVTRKSFGALRAPSVEKAFHELRIASSPSAEEARPPSDTEYFLRRAYTASLKPPLVQRNPSRGAVPLSSVVRRLQRVDNSSMYKVSLEAAESMMRVRAFGDHGYHREVEVPVPVTPVDVKSIASEQARAIKEGRIPSRPQRRTTSKPLLLYPSDVELASFEANVDLTRRMILVMNDKSPGASNSDNYYGALVVCRELADEFNRMRVNLAVLHRQEGDEKSNEQCERGIEFVRQEMQKAYARAGSKKAVSY